MSAHVSRAHMARTFPDLVLPPADERPSPPITERYVTIRMYASGSGFTVNAIRQKICNGVWIEKREYFRTPEGAVMVDRQGVDRWITGKS